MPNLVALGQTVLAQVRVPKILGTWGPTLSNGGMADFLETRSYPHCKNQS